MDKYFAGTMLILMLATGGAGVSKTEEINKPPPPPKASMKPPPEAYTVCKGKTEGTEVQFTTPRGEKLKGVCRQYDGVLVAIPERKGPPPGGSNKPGETASSRQTDK